MFVKFATGQKNISGKMKISVGKQVCILVLQSAQNRFVNMSKCGILFLYSIPDVCRGYLWDSF